MLVHGHSPNEFAVAVDRILPSPNVHPQAEENGYCNC